MARFGRGFILDLGGGGKGAFLFHFILSKIVVPKKTIKSRICITLQIDSAFETYDTFFNLSDEVKEKYSKKEGTSPDGWDALEREGWVQIFSVTQVNSDYRSVTLLQDSCDIFTA